MRVEKLLIEMTAEVLMKTLKGNKIRSFQEVDS